MAAWQTIRVFVSSTFRDMQAERDVLVRRVFPALQERLAPYRIRLVEIDLRWGVTEQQGAQNEVLGLCLREIDRARPYFIGLLGSRYGSILQSVPAETLERYGWMPAWEPAKASITELEMLHGALDRLAEGNRALFYFRDPASLLEAPASMRAFLTDDPEAVPHDAGKGAPRVAQLRERLLRQGVERADDVIERMLAGDPPLPSIARHLRPWDRLEILKERLRRAGLVNVDGYGSKLLGLRVRWNLARASLQESSLLRRLESACVAGVVSPAEFEQFAGEPEITAFLRQYGTVAFDGLDELAAAVREDLWNRLASDPDLKERLQSSRNRDEAAGPLSAEKKKEMFLTWVNHMIPQDRIPKALAELSPEAAEQFLQGALQTNATARGEMLRTAKLWHARRDDGDTDGGVAGNWEEERDGHQRYAEAKLSLYVPRLVPENAIEARLLAPGGTILGIVGPAGSGKSALVARTAGRLSELARRENGVCVCHYVGATPSSGSLLGILKRLSAELGLIPARQVEELATDVHDLAAAFAQAFGALPAGPPVYVIIDALDQMEPEHSAHDLHWLPVVLPKHVRVVVSLATDEQEASSEQILSALRLRDAAWVDLADHPLEDRDRHELIERIPSLAAKSLEPEHIAALLDNPGTRNPLYLTIAMEELRGFGSRELLSARIAQFREARNPTDLFIQVIEGMRIDFEPEVVRLVLSSLAISRQGLSEPEMAAVVRTNLGAAGEQRRHLDEETAVVLRYLSPYLQWRGRLLDFNHRCIRAAVEKAYLGDAEAIREMHRWVGEHFEQQGRQAKPTWMDAGRRSISEAPYHYIRGAHWSRLLTLFNEDELVFRKGRSPYNGELAREYAEALALAPEEHATALAIAFVRCASQHFALTDVARDALIGLARRDEKRFLALGHLLVAKGDLWRYELLKAGAVLIHIRLDSSAEVVLEAVRQSYDGDEPPDSSRVSMFQHLSTLRNSQGRHEEAMGYAKQGAAMAKEIGDVVNAAILKASIVSVAASLGRHEEAARLVQELFEEGGANPAIDRVLPRVALYGFRSLVELGRIPEAEKYMREALDLCLRLTKAENEYAALALTFAQHCIANGKPEEAIPPLRNALSWRVGAYPEELRPDLYAQLAACLNQAGRKDELVSAVESALRSPRSARERTRIGQLFGAVIPGGAAGSAPGSRDQSNQLAKALEQKGDLEGAERAYKSGLEAAPNDIILLGNYAFFLQNFRRDFAGARELYLRALGADPRDSINQTNFAGLCLVTGALQEAEERLREAWRLVAGRADRYTARTLFLRAALAAFQQEDSAVFLGQLKTLFGQGIESMPSRNVSVREHLQRNLPVEGFALLDAVYTAINEPAGAARLAALPAWQIVQTRRLEEAWPERSR